MKGASARSTGDSNSGGQSNANSQRGFIELSEDVNGFDKRKYGQSKAYAVRSDEQLVSSEDLEQGPGIRVQREMSVKYGRTGQSSEKSTGLEPGQGTVGKGQTY